MIILIKALQVILALSVLVLIHELGHFFFAKIFGIRVDKFYLFFDAGGFSLLKWKPKNSDTEYGIGWLPLGGYCKISGMVDESLDTDFIKKEPQPWEFRSKPAWQRFLVIGGGVLFNFIFAICIYSGMLAHWGESYLSNEGNSIYVNELSHEMGFRNGDRILRFDDYVPEDFGMLQADLARRTARKATVLRGNDTLDIYIDHSMLGKVLNTPGMFDLARPFIVSEVVGTSPNAESGLMEGDRIISIAGASSEFVQDARPVLVSHKGETVSAVILRGKDTLEMDVRVDTTGALGVMLQAPDIRTKEYSFVSAVPAGFNKTFATIGGYVKDLKLVFTPSTEAYKSVGSFITMGQIFPSSWNWYVFLNLLALLSVMLGVMNLLPIPALDGGHLILILYEMISGKKPSDKFVYATQMIGMILIFGLMFLAFGNDIARLFR